MAELLRIENLRIDFQTSAGGMPVRAHVVDGVNLSVDDGEVVGLVGESGCGKTLAAKAVMGILPKQAQLIEGRISFKGTNVLELTEEKRHMLRGREIALIPQDPMTSLNPVFTIEDQILAVIKWKGTPNITLSDYLRFRSNSREREPMKKLASDMLYKVKFPDVERALKSYPVQLSGGMKQRILIAMALLCNPSLIIADEPGTGLDVLIQAEIHDILMKRVKEEGISGLYLTHDLGVARRICDRIYVMYAGTIAEAATRSDLFVAPKHPYTKGLLASVPKVSGGIGEGIPGMIPNYYAPPLGCRFHPRCPLSMEICKKAKPPFIEVTPRHATSCYLYSGRNHE